MTGPVSVSPQGPEHAPPLLCHHPRLDGSRCAVCRAEIYLPASPLRDGDGAVQTVQVPGCNLGLGMTLEEKDTALRATPPQERDSVCLLVRCALIEGHTGEHYSLISCFEPDLAVWFSWSDSVRAVSTLKDCPYRTPYDACILFAGHGGAHCV